MSVVDENGRVRLVLANSERQAVAVMNGKPLGGGRRRPAGLIFFNDEGDEDGGLVFQAAKDRASASLTFDHIKQDQVVPDGRRRRRG